MNIGILGTGMVARAHAIKLTELGHTVTLGSHDIAHLESVTEIDAKGNVPFSEWHNDHPAVQLGTLVEAAQHGEIIINALKGEVVLSTLTKIKDVLGSKILIDISNPLDFSKGFPPSLFIVNTDSLGEQIQHALPDVKVIKTFNTLSARLQVSPQSLADADHHIFVSGNDADAKAQVMAIQKAYGWKHIIDVGDITSARGTEMILPMYFRLMGVLQYPLMNFKIVIN